MVNIGNIVFLGIDTSKDYVDVGAKDLYGVELMPITRFSQDIDGYQKLEAKALELKEKTGGAILFGIESTGIYHLPLYDFLTKNGHHVRVFNGLEIRGLRKTRVRKTGTDAIDARLISNSLRFCDEPYKKSPVPTELRNLREFCRIRERLVFKNRAIKNQLVRNLDLVFPGFTNLFKNKLGKSLVELLVHACTPKQIQRMPIEKLRKYVSAAKAERIKELASRSQGALDFDKAVKFEVKSLIRLGKQILKELEKIDEAIKKELKRIGNPISTIGGIGPITAPVIITELGDIHAFDHPKKVVAFAGIDPVIKESGKMRYEFHISKRGGKLLRTALYQAAFSGSMFNPVLKAYYQKKRAEGKCHKDAITCCARKLCYIIYSVWKNNKPFYVPPNITSEN